jgi:hypothetical protein
MFSQGNISNSTVDSPSLCMLEKGMKEREMETHGVQIFCS